MVLHKAFYQAMHWKNGISKNPQTLKRRLLLFSNKPLV